MPNNLVMTDFNQQGIQALQKGQGIGRSMQNRRMLEQKQQMMAQQQQQGNQLFGQKTKINEQNIDLNQLSIQQKEQLKGQSELITALNLPFDKRNELFAELEEDSESKDKTKILKHLQTLGDKEQIGTMLSYLKAQQQGVGGEAKDTRTPDIKNYEYFVNLKKTNPEEAREFGIKSGIIDENGIPKLKFSDVNIVNTGIKGLVGKYKEIHATAKDLDKLMTISSGPAQVAMIFKFMKALDPTSVVREGEFATAENSSGIPERIFNIYNKINSGERLTAPQMKSFVDVAKSLSNSRGENISETVSLYLDTFDMKPSQKNRFTKTANFKPFKIEGATSDLLPTPAIPGAATQQPAPTGAINYLLANPSAAEEFKAKYGYLPGQQ